MKPELRMRIEAMAKTLKTTFSKFQTRVIAQRLHRSTWHPSGQGVQETARRRRQIERGQLTKSNGLVERQPFGRTGNYFFTREMMMTVRAKLRLTKVTEYKWGVDAKPHKTLHFEAQYDPSIPEDQRFQAATPSGHCELSIDNPAALAQFEHGKAYYVDFTPAAE